MFTSAYRLLYFSNNFHNGMGSDEPKKKKYEADSERDAHIGRHMNLFSSGFYEPPLALSLPLLIEKIKLETSSELEQLKKGQTQCRFISFGSQKCCNSF